MTMLCRKQHYVKSHVKQSSTLAISSMNTLFPEVQPVLAICCCTFTIPGHKWELKNLAIKPYKTLFPTKNPFES